MIFSLKILVMTLNKFKFSDIIWQKTRKFNYCNRFIKGLNKTFEFVKTQIILNFPYFLQNTQNEIGNYNTKGRFYIMQNFFWSVFEKSGSVDAIMAYIKYNEVIRDENCKNSGNCNKRDKIGWIG